jgi:hypothetical protein
MGASRIALRGVLEGNGAATINLIEAFDRIRLALPYYLANINN